MKTPAEYWDDYRRRTLPVDASAVQIAETRRAFMAGMVCMDSLLNGLAAMPIDQATDALSVIKDELLKVSLSYMSEAHLRSQA